MIISKPNPLSHRFEATIVVALATAMPSNKGSSAKRKRSEIPTQRRRNPDTDDPVPDGFGSPVDDENDIVISDIHKDGNRRLNESSITQTQQALENVHEINGSSNDQNQTPPKDHGNDHSIEGNVSSVMPAHIASDDALVNDNLASERWQESMSGVKRKLDALIDKPKQGKSDDNIDRVTRIRGVLKHRKMLLNRVRQSCAAANKRIAEQTVENPLFRSLTEAEEIELHKDLTKQVTSVVKKLLIGTEPPQSDTQIENPQLPASDLSNKKLSISLRRGSSVGRRMNAALSALAPGGAGSGTGTTEDPLEATSSIFPTNSADFSSFSSQLVSQPEIQLVESSTSPTTKNIVDRLSRDVPSIITPIATVPQRPTILVPSMESDTLADEKQINASTAISRPLTQKSLLARTTPAAGRSNNLVKQSYPINTNDLLDSQEFLAKTKKNKDVVLPSSNKGNTKNAHNLPQRQQQRKKIPETISLRENRNLIHRKLSSVMFEREKRMQVSSADSVMSQTHSSMSYNTQGLHSMVRPRRRTKHDWAMQIKGPDETLKLPSKRKTHWDIVLEEMRWMASDFVEERKWKQSTAKLLGCESVRVSRVPLKNARLREKDGSSISSDNSYFKKSSNTERKFFSKTSKETGPSLEKLQKRSAYWHYVEASQEDQILCRNVANTVSSGIKLEFSGKFFQNILSNGRSTRTDDVHVTTFILSDASVDTAISLTGTDSHNISESISATPLNRDQMYRRVSNFIETTLRKLSNLQIKKTTQAGNELGSCGLSLAEKQVKVIQTIETVFSDVQVGSILHGPSASGKTILACSLLWQNRSKGPQLLVCSSISMVRWVHELSRFNGVHLVTFHSKRNEKRPLCLEISDIMICDHPSVMELTGQELSSFRIIVIDSRYSDGYSGSRSLSPDEERIRNPSSTLCQRNKNTPPELLSVEWWRHLATSCSTNCFGRLLIHKNGPKDDFLYFKGVSRRETLQLLALRLAFLYGADIFGREQFPLPKGVLAWVRRRVKTEGKSNNKFDSVRTVFALVCDPLFCPMDSSKLLDIHDGVTQSIPWEIRKAHMPPEQARTYEITCRHVRSKLSGSLDGADNSTSMALLCKGLIYLRRQCTHTSIGSVLAKYLNQNDKACKVFGNAAQPDFDLAYFILKGSSKMQHLLTILTNEVNSKYPCRDFVETLAAFEKKWPALKVTQQNLISLKKVVILATLPEVQIMVSLLLNSLGIANELLLNLSKPNSSKNKNELASAFEMDVVAWTRAQLLLSEFNTTSNGRSCIHSVIIAAPTTIAADTGGLGVELADIVICIDEDWSGKEEVVLQALYNRCCARRRAESLEECRFLKVISEKTCEASFLCGTKHSIEALSYQVPRVFLPLNNMGLFIGPQITQDEATQEAFGYWLAREPKLGAFTYPCCNILAYRDVDLVDVLGLSARCGTFTARNEKTKFLPHNSSICAEAKFVAALLIEEDSARHSFDSYRCSNVDVLAIDMSVVPPLITHFPPGFANNPDLAFVAIKLYVESIKESSKPKATDDQLLLVSHEGQENQQLVIEPDTAVMNVDAYMSSESSTYRNPAKHLFYFSAWKTSDTSEIDSVSKLPTKIIAFKRQNGFARSFSFSSASEAEHDGNEGTEGLVYFPPLFPGILECSYLARRSVENLYNRRPSGHQIHRVSAFMQVLDERLRQLDQSPESSTRKSATAPRLITEDEANHSDAASVLLDFCDDFGLAGIGAISLPVDSFLIAATKSVDSGHGHHVGNRTNEWLGSVPLCDKEEMESVKRLGSLGGKQGTMLLLVSRKRSRNQSFLLSTQSRRSHTGYFSGSAAFAQSTKFARADICKATRLAFPRESRSSSKKKKKLVSMKDSQSSSILDVNPPNTTMMPGTNEANGGIGAFGQRVLTSLRQASTGFTMFESDSFRVASIRVRHRVMDRVHRLTWTPGPTYDSGPGLPLACGKAGLGSLRYRGMFDVDPNLWTSIVKRLKTRDSVTGGESLVLAKVQALSLRSSIVAPCRVDFGPFQIGFLSSLEGSAIVAVSSPRAGIVPPMGVTVAPTAKAPTAIPWSSMEVENLKQSVLKFGVNWTIASRVVSGFSSGPLGSKDTSIISSTSRTSRSCRDRWHSLVASSMSSDDDVQKREILRFNALRKGPTCKSLVSSESRRIHSQTSVDYGRAFKQTQTLEVLLSNEAAEAKTGKNSENHNQTFLKSKRSFAAYGVAKSKKEIIPLTIPGVQPGSPPTIVPGHVSHEQAIQTAVAVSWTGGRTEMWPIQLLDALDRQKASLTVESNSLGNSALRPPSQQQQAPAANNSPTAPSFHQHRQMTSSVQQPQNHPSVTSYTALQQHNATTSPSRSSQARSTGTYPSTTRHPVQGARHYQYPKADDGNRPL